MMKHENPSKPIPIGNNHNNGVVPIASPNAGKRSIWRSRSSSEAPASAPKSPITKAFDFLPWSRSRKSAAEKAAIANSVNTVGNKDANTVESRDTSEEYKKDCINYHRNIFRNSGGIIRDILGDKLNKERSQVLSSDAVGNSNLPNPHSLKSNQRRPKQVVARNKSLDINELIDCVENELAVDKKNFARSRFIDDTFIENIIRAKNEYHRNSRLQGDQHQDDYIYSNNYYGDELLNSPESIEKRKENNNASTPSKHILFNDENIVYLIKKELPVKREMSKTKSAIEHNSRANQQKTSNGDKERKHERSTSVLRARLKFKKVAPPETAPLSEHRSQAWNNQQKHPQPHQSASERSNYLQSKSVIDNCALIGMASVGLSLINPAGGSFKQSSTGLQRQNTLPAAPPSHHNSVNDSAGPHQGRHHPRSEQHSLRRKSLTDTSYENNLCFDNSSSSSMGSGGGGGVGVGGGIINDRSKAEKPRKKLSFREPVVSEKGRSRRISTPLQKSPGSPVGGVNSVVTTDGSSNACVSQSAMQGNCDNSNQLLDQRFARNGTECAAADQTTAADTESQAMRIVRTVGQAFEVCHKFNLHKNSLDNNDERSDVSSDLLDVDHISEHQLSDDDVAKKDHNAVTPDLNPPQRPNHLELVPQTNLNIRKSPCVLTDDEKSPTTPSSPNREIHKLKDQLEQQALQTRQALAQLMLVREQLISETNARIEAQARTQQLLQQNRELLEHLASLGAYTEQQAPGLTTANIAMAPQLSSTAKVARWFQQFPWNTASLSRPESGFVSGDSRSEKYNEDHNFIAKDTDDLCDEFLLVEGSSTIWTKLSAKKRRKLLGMRLGKVTTF